MIKQEIVEGHEDLIRTYSDAGKFVVNQDGDKYAEAIDPKSFIDDGTRSYTESEEDIPVEPEHTENEEIAFTAPVVE